MAKQSKTNPNQGIVLYLAGQMTGLPNYNYPAFIRAEAKLRKAGYDVVNPALLNEAGETWEKCLRNDLKHIVTKCNGMAVLDSWMNSRGARLEVSTAIQLGMLIIRVKTLKKINLEMFVGFDIRRRNGSIKPVGTYYIQY